MKTFEDVCEKLDINIDEIIVDYPDYVFKSENILEAIEKEISFTKLSLITQAFNSDFAPNWECSNKFFFRSKEDTSYCANQFLDLFKKALS